MGFSQSWLAAKLQEYVSKRREDAGLYSEIAGHLPLENAQRLLDVGTGTGLQLRVVGNTYPEIELYGLDLSARAIQAAEKYFDPTKVDLRAGSIESTTYPDNYFDNVTCNASMSYWQNLVACYNEIHRILKAGGSAHLFEPRKNIDIDAAIEQIRENMQGENRLRIWLATSMNKYGLRRGDRLGMELYEMVEIKEIASQSNFSQNVSVEPVTLQNLPIFMKISLTKPAR